MSPHLQIRGGLLSSRDQRFRRLRGKGKEDEIIAHSFSGYVLRRACPCYRTIDYRILMNVYNNYSEIVNVGY